MNSSLSTQVSSTPEAAVIFADDAEENLGAYLGLLIQQRWLIASVALIGGLFDLLVARVIDVFMAFPGTLLAIALAGVLGPGVGNVVIALCAVSWVGFARLARAQAFFERQGFRRVGVGDVPAAKWASYDRRRQAQVAVFRLDLR